MILEMETQRVGDVAVVRSALAVFERAGSICHGETSGVRYEQVGEIKRFTQLCRSPSLRLARVALKIMRREAFAPCH